MMNGIKEELLVHQLRRPNPCAIARVSDDVRLVERYPMPHTITKPSHHRASVFKKALHGIAADPASLLLDPLWQVPMMQAHPWFDADREHGISESVIKRQPCFV
jgi:hypothetical protein